MWLSENPDNIDEKRLSFFLCGLHEVYSHIMVSPDLFIYLCIYLFICLRESSVCHVVYCSSLGSSSSSWSYHELVLLARASRYRPSLCYNCRLYKRFYVLTLVEFRYGLYCFVFYGCIVVYSVPHKSVLTRKLIWPMSPMVCTCKFRSTSMSHTR